MDLRKIDIVEVKSAEGRADVQYLHKTIWGLTDLLVVPGHILIAAQRTNGLSLCAYYDGKPVGFSFGFLGLTDDHAPYYWDHLIGILPDCQGLGIGYTIKLRQREIMLNRGIGLAMWTFEPLDSIIAHLNFKKLGCVCKKYVRDYYGAMSSPINKDIPSDRLVVEWPLEGSPTAKHFQIPRSQILNETMTNESGLLKPQKSHVDMIRMLLEKGIGHMYVEIPNNYQELRKRDMETVLEWRFAIRHLLENCFDSGMVVDGFVLENDKSYYMLRKTE